MSAVQRFFSNRHSLVRAAAVSASSVRASHAIERTQALRAGGGRVRLVGPYTGHEAALWEVQLQASASGVPRTSAVQFVGVGNGALSASAGAGASLQELSFSLVDLGVATQAAALDVREVRLRARVAGAAGNAIRVRVTPALTRVRKEATLLSDWPAGQALVEGAQWDLGGLPLSAKGELDGASPRLSFGSDPQVYRQFRQFKEGAWRFGLTPAPQGAIKAGLPVYGVSGGYEVTITDGVVTESFGAAPGAAVVTFYDLLAALASSALVEVAGVVAADRSPGGQAAMDVPLRTSAWLLAQSGGVRLDEVSVPPDAPTQSVTVRCINNDGVGRERWSVVGDVSGALPVAQTGVPYAAAGVCGFTLPVKELTTAGGGDASFSWNPAPRDAEKGEGFPCAALRPIRLGVAAVAKSVTFRYSKRPPADCRCDNVPTPFVSGKCLGLGGADVALEPAVDARIKALYAWRETFVRANTALRPPGVSPGSPAQPGTPGQPGVPPVPAVTAWGFSFWLKNDLSYTWLRVQSIDRFADEAQAQAAAQAAMMACDESSPLPAGHKHGDELTLGGHRVRLHNPDFLLPVADPIWSNPWSGSASEETISPGIPGTPGTPGTPATPGSPTPLQFAAYARDLDWMEQVIGLLVPPLMQVFEDAPALAAWDALWVEVQADLALLQNAKEDLQFGNDANPRFLDRYRATLDNILLLVGIVPKSNPSGSDAGSCWVDYEEPFWWVDTEGFYLPAFSNRAYISARRDPVSGKAVSTQEFGFGLVVACPDRLKVGDEITLRIRSVDTERPYRVGDEALLQTVGAGDAYLTGGVDGSDVLTWRVVGSSDGLLPPYVMPSDGSPAPPYGGAAGVQATIALGGIAFALGDMFRFAVEAGQFRWRKDGGPWSALLDCPTGAPAPLSDGVQAWFDPGAAPSFVPGDRFLFTAHQPWAASHLRDAQDRAWGWEGADAVLSLDWGALQPLGAVALARCALPAGAALAFQWSADGLAWSAPVALEVARPVAVAMLPAVVSARYLRLTISAGTGGAIGWLWAGVPLALSWHASSCQRSRRWALASASEGVNAPALYAGVGEGWRLAWDDCLRDSDVAALAQLIDWARLHDEPLVLLPHHLHPQDAALVRPAVQALDVTDSHEYQPDDTAFRRLSAALEFEPVFAAG